MTCTRCNNLGFVRDGSNTTLSDPYRERVPCPECSAPSRESPLPRCIGFGPYDCRKASTSNHCKNPADANDARLWCTRCEALRREHLGDQFTAITEAFHA